jgi:hypothetical protein
MNRVLAALAVLAVAAALLSCSDDQQRYDAVCVDPVSHIRVDDWHCQSHSNDWIWWYLLHAATMPRVGYVAVGGYRTAPTKVKIVYGGVPTAGRYVKPPAPRVNAPQLNVPRPPAVKPPAPRVIVRPPKIR